MNPMSHDAVRSASHGLWRLIGWYAAGQLAALAVLPAVWSGHLESVSAGDPLGLSGLPARVLRVWSLWDYWITVALLAVSIFMLQAGTFIGVRRSVPRLKRPLGLWLSCLPVGLALVPLVATAVFVIAAAMQRFVVLADFPDPPVRIQRYLPLIYLGVVFGLWALGTLIARWMMFRWMRRGGTHEESLSLVGRRLLLTVGVLALLTLPLDIAARLSGDSFQTLTAQPLTLCGLMAITVLGPLVILPRLGRSRAAWYAARCERCGYEKGVVDGTGHTLPRCPECALEWQQASRTVAEPQQSGPCPPIPPSPQTR